MQRLYLFNKTNVAKILQITKITKMDTQKYGINIAFIQQYQAQNDPKTCTDCIYSAKPI